jgi:hypothetical protein
MFLSGFETFTIVTNTSSPYGSLGTAITEDEKRFPLKLANVTPIRPTYYGSKGMIEELFKHLDA